MRRIGWIACWGLVAAAVLAVVGGPAWLAYMAGGGDGTVRASPLFVAVMIGAATVVVLRFGWSALGFARTHGTRIAAAVCAGLGLLAVSAGSIAAVSPPWAAPVVHPVRHNVSPVVDANAWRRMATNARTAQGINIAAQLSYERAISIPPVLKQGQPVTVFALPGRTTTTIQPFAIANATHILPLRTISPSLVRNLASASIPVQQVVVFPAPPPNVVAGPRADTRVTYLQYGCGSCSHTVQVEVNPEFVDKLVWEGAKVLSPVPVAGRATVGQVITLLEVVGAFNQSSEAGKAKLAGVGTRQLIQAITKGVTEDELTQAVGRYFGSAAGRAVTNALGGARPEPAWTWKVREVSGGRMGIVGGTVTWLSDRRTTYYGTSLLDGWNSTWTTRVVESTGRFAPSYNPPSYNPPRYNPPSYNPPRYNPPSYNPPSYNPPRYNPPPFNPPRYNPPSYNPPSYRPPSYSPPVRIR